MSFPDVRCRVKDVEEEPSGGAEEEPRKKKKISSSAFQETRIGPLALDLRETDWPVV